MASEFEHLFESRSPAATQKLGARLGRVLVGGEVLALGGDLGAGKTAFVQGLARGLEVTSARVASPSFTIVNEHAGRVPLVHIDLYRIADPGELEEIGLRDYFGRSAVVAIEWFERAFDMLPADRLELRIAATSATSRQLTARALGPGAAAALRAWIG